MTEVDSSLANITMNTKDDLQQQQQQSKIDLLNDEPPQILIQTLPQLLRKSLKRTFDMFAGNVGVSIPKSTDLIKHRQKSIHFKTLDEFESILSKNALDSQRRGHSKTPNLQQQHPLNQKALTAEPTTSSFTQASSMESTQILLASRTPETTNHPLGPQQPLSLLSNSTTTQSTELARLQGNSSTALQHLIFRRPPKIPKAVEHPQWELMRVISGHQGWVRCLSIDPTNEWFVSGGNDRLIKIWDLATGTLKLSLTGHINTIRAVEVSHRHPYLFSCGEDQMVKCWDLEYNKVIRHYHGHLSGVYSMALHPTLDILSTGGRDAVVRVWDMRTKLAVHVLSGHTGTIMSLASQRYEPQIISGSLDKMIRCWDLAAGKTSVILTHHKKAIRSLALHPREYTFCSAGADHLKIWKCPKGNFERNLEAVNTIMNSITIRDDPESAIVVGGSDQGHLHFWDWASGKKFQTIETIPQPGSLSSERGIYAVRLDMSETRLLTAECDKTIKVWREKTE